MPPREASPTGTDPASPATPASRAGQRADPGRPQALAAIDRSMDRASRALVEARYFEAADLSKRALRSAAAVGAWERVSRICLPLQEARRQIRQSAVDEAEAAPPVGAWLIMTEHDLPHPPAPGLYLLQPPLIGADARRLRDLLDAHRVPAAVLTREPLTKAGRWPIVGVGPDVVVRTQVDPAYAVKPQNDRVCRDDATEPPGPRWFQAALEALGDAAIASAYDDPGVHPAHRAEELIERLDAVPDHEKLHQRLAETAIEASRVPPPPTPRRPRAHIPGGF